MTAAGLDFKNPGSREYLVAGGAALGLALLYFWLNRNKTSGSPAAGGAPAPVTPVPASGHGLGAAPGNQSFLPGGASPTGNAFTDTVFANPTVPSPGAAAAAGGSVVAFPVRHVPQGAESILGSSGGTGTVSSASSNAPLTPATTTAGTATSLSGQWQGSSLFTSPVSPLAWANSILAAIPAPKTAANQQSLIAWALNEGGGGSYNPLNTTMGSQYPAFNSVGVRNFPNWAVGAQETAATIQNGRYPNILAGLQSGKGIGSNASADLMTWSGSGYSGIAGSWAKAGAILAADVRAQAAAAAKKARARPVKAATPARIRSLFPVVRPVANRTPVRRPAPGWGNLGSIFARISHLFGPPPPPRRRPVPPPVQRRGRGF